MEYSEYSVEPQSYFGKKLAADPELRARCEEVRRAIVEAGRPDIEAGERSEQLTAKDIAIFNTFFGFWG